MSCIKKLAEQQKQTNGIFYIDDKTALESCGEYKGYDYCITFNYNGYRCAYVAVPKNHYYADKDKAEAELKVSGGVSFHGDPNLINNTCDDIWVGFDSGFQDVRHGLDLFPDAPFLNWVRDNLQAAPISGGRLAITNKAMTKECKSLIDQIAKK
jgi:hypothetical protein